MKIIECKGSPKEIGRQTGEETREEILEHLRLYPPPSHRKWQDRVAVFVETLKANLPDVHEEMLGLAAGADVPVEKIYGLNFPGYADDLTAEQCCTNVAIAAGPDGPLWGKNNDGAEPDRQRPICTRVIRPNTGIPLVMTHFCGMVAVTDFMNAEGVAVGHSSVGSVFQQSDRFVPIRLWAYHAIQQAKSTAEFVRLVASVPVRGKGYSHVCVDRGGNICSIEAPCPLVQVRQPQDPRYVYCVNCYFLSALVEADRRTEKQKVNAMARRKVLEGELKPETPVDLARLQDLLKLHKTPAGICRHGGSDGSHTEYSIIALPQDGRYLIAPGYPCKTEYIELSV